MSGWIEATKEVYRAGGKIAVRDMQCPLDDIRYARDKGLISPGNKGAGGHMAELTWLGWQFCEGRAEIYIPSSRGTTGGRAHGSCRKLRATWLAALPRTNEIRITA